MSCASYENFKGHLQLNTGNEAGGIESLEAATHSAPTDAAYKEDYLDHRDDSARAAIARGDAARAEGKLADAQAAYEHALKMDRGNERARAGLAELPQDARYEQLLTEGEKYLAEGRVDLARERAQQVLDANPTHRRARKLLESATDALAQVDSEAARTQAAKSVLQKTVTLQFANAPLRTVFEALSRTVGLNLLLDKDVKETAPVSIFVKDIAVGDAIDFILLQNQLEKRVVNSNTLMIFPATDAKKAEYEDLSIRTFQVTNADIKYLTGMLKTMLKVKDISADERTGILVIRDTPEKLRLAQRLIAAHDVPDPEIMLEVEILEVSTSRASDLGIQLPTSFSVTTPGTQGSLTWGALRGTRRNDLLVSPLSAQLNFLLQDTDTKLLARPRIRALNKAKAKILIGDRVPTVTNSVTPMATGASVVTGSVSYQDVGLKLEFEPQVYSNDEVGIKISLEVSSIEDEFTDAQGSRSYQIGTRDASTDLRLKDGETQILGGLISDNDRNVASKIPGLGHLPVVGDLFGNNNGSRDRGEILMAITPHIVRNLPNRAPDVKNIFSGTYNEPREKPILADPISMVRGGAGAIGGTNASAVQAPPLLGGSGTPAASTQNSPAPAQSAVGVPPAVAPSGQSLPAPPAMFVRPAPGSR